MPEPDRILRTRIDLLRRNLAEVERVLDTIEERRRDMRDLLELPYDQELETALRGIEAQIMAARDARNNGRRVDECLDGMTASATKIRQVLRNAGNAVESVRERWLQLGSGDLHDTLSDLLVAKAHEQIEELDEIRDELAASQDEQQRRERATEAWTKLAVNAQESTQEVFREYVDLLGGLALRETGFDQGICTVADKLVSKAGTTGFRWSSVTIPVREEALNVTLAWIVRLGFPEWTIWALPLAAHELGHVIVRQTMDMQAFIGGRAGLGTDEARDLQVCMADAFATYVMGPAYACCAILLRLDPLTAYGEDGIALPGRRAEVVLAMLEHANERSKQKPWGQIADELRREWNAALAQAGHQATASTDDPETQRLVAFMAKKTGVGRGLPAGKWGRIAEWAQKLRDGTHETITPAFDDELRFVLNAAWLCRLTSPSTLELDDVAERALALWARIEAAHSGQGGGPSWAVTGSVG